jgi:hypothetical protein
MRTIFHVSAHQGTPSSSKSIVTGRRSQGSWTQHKFPCTTTEGRCDRDLRNEKCVTVPPQPTKSTWILLKLLQLNWIPCRDNESNEIFRNEDL